jgi:ferredoxin like protein
MKVEEKVAKNAIKPHTGSHIELHEAECAVCATRACIAACPAGLYQVEPATGRVMVDHAGCLECGTCLIVCPRCGVTWKYPEPGHGIHYRHG